MTMVRRNPPTRGLAVGPTTALDHEIMAQLADGQSRRPVEIAQAIGDRIAPGGMAKMLKEG